LGRAQVLRRGHVLADALTQRLPTATRVEAARPALRAQVLQHQRPQVVSHRHHAGGLAVVGEGGLAAGAGQALCVSAEGWESAPKRKTHQLLQKAILAERTGQIWLEMSELCHLYC